MEVLTNYAISNENDLIAEYCNNNRHFKIFFNNKELRYITDYELPNDAWFNAADLEYILGITNIHKTLSHPAYNGHLREIDTRLHRDQARDSRWRQTTVENCLTNGYSALKMPRQADTTYHPIQVYIDEWALYRIVMRANTQNPEIINFQNWIIDVLRTIRIYGCYIDPEYRAKFGDNIEYAKYLATKYKNLSKLGIEEYLHYLQTRKKVMCHTIPDDIREKLSYEDYKKLKDSLNN